MNSFGVRTPMDFSLEERGYNSNLSSQNIKQSRPTTIEEALR
jgi:hypothetical protein